MFPAQDDAVKPSFALRIPRTLVGTITWLYPGPRCAALMLGFSVLELSLLAMHPLGFWRNGGLHWSAGAALAAVVVLMWAAVGWLAYWYVEVARCLVRRTKRRGTVRLLVMASFVVAANFYLASWLFFWRLGVFPDSDATWFGLLNFQMLCKYFWQAERAAMWRTVLALSSLTSLAVLVGRGILRDARDGSTRGGRAVWPGLLVILLAGDSFWITSEMGRGPELSQHPTGRARIDATLNPWPPLSYELCHHVNPAISTMCGLLIERGSEPAEELPIAEIAAPRGRTARGPARAPAPPRSVVFITVESLRADVVGRRHQGRLVMPQLTALAARGKFFPDCYAQSTHSDYSDPCILSSLYPLRDSRHHFYRRSDPWPKVLIYDVLKEHGYATAIFSSQNEAWSNMHVFYESPGLDVLFDSRSYAGPSHAVGNFFRQWTAHTGLAGKLDDRVTAGSAIDWMRRQQQQDKPFFVSVNFQTSHFPYRLPAAAGRPFAPNTIDFDAGFSSYPPEKADVMRNAYFNALHYVDEQVARLVAFLEESGERDSTLLFVTGDHGEAFYENGVAGHGGEPLETTTKVGLVIHCPALLTPRVDPYLAQAIDLVPTCLGLLGTDGHPAFQGIDLLDSRRPRAERRLVFIHTSSPVGTHDAVLSGTGWKYVWDNQERRGTLLFRPSDLQPHRNLAADHPHVTAALDSLLEQWRRRQLLYYQRPRYYHWFFPPRSPQISNAVRGLLIDRQPGES